MLGKGGFAKCYLVKEYNEHGSDSQQYAAKIIDKKSLTKPKTKQKLGTEIKIHQSMKHEHIVDFKKFFEDRSSVYIILEVCHCKSMMELHKSRKRITELETKYLLIQLLHAVKYMHENRVIHRDLKLGNIFLDQDMQVKIGDFGLAAQLEHDEERKRTICGTPNYIAPEILSSSMRGHSYEVDVWSIGVILYTLIIGKPPFETASVKTTYSKIKATSYSFPPNVPISVEAKDLIGRILTRDPTKRPTIDQIFQHPFFSNETEDLTLCPKLLRDYAQRETGKVPAYVIRDYHSHMPNELKGGSGERVPFKPIENNQLSNRMNSSGDVSRKRKSIYSSTGESESAYDLTGRASSRQETSEEQLPKPSVWVSQWADFSQKYGLAYSLNRNQTGAHFNDATKMIWHHDTDQIDYYERVKTPQGSYDLKHNHQINDYPETLKKKITLIKYFRKYLNKISKEKRDSMSDTMEDSKHTETNMVYVKRWMRTKDAVIFRLSNKTVHVCFRDTTELILSSEARLVTYRDTNKKQETFSINWIVQRRNTDVEKRLKYTKNILKQLISR